MAISTVNSDLEIHFNKNKFTNDIALVKDIYSIRQSLINLILTIPGEKPFSRNFGTRINDSLFDNYTPMDAAILELEITTIIKLFEPRIDIDIIIIDDAPITDKTSIVPGHNIDAAKVYNADINLLYIYISYFIVNLSGPGQTLRDAISIGLTKVR